MRKELEGERVRADGAALELANVKKEFLRTQRQLEEFRHRARPARRPGGQADRRMGSRRTKRWPAPRKFLLGAVPTGEAAGLSLSAEI